MTPSPHPAEAQEREAIPAEIMRIIESLHTQDNRITDNPLFAVQQRRRIYGLDRDYEDGHVFDDEGTETGRRVGYKDTWEFVTGCLTEQGCKDFIAVNGHNLHEPRIYAYGSYRNAEFIALRKWLMSLRGASHAPAAAAESGDPIPEDVRQVWATAPKRIWLDIGGPDEGSHKFSDLEGVTWSEDNATSYGIAYVRADLAAASGEAVTDEQIDAIDLRKFHGSPSAKEWLRGVARAVLALAKANPAADDDTSPLAQAQMVCAEAYQVVGSLLSDLGQFGTGRAEKVLDNLSQHRMVHSDVLPWPSFAANPAAGTEPVAIPRVVIDLGDNDKREKTIHHVAWEGDVLAVCLSVGPAAGAEPSPVAAMTPTGIKFYSAKQMRAIKPGAQFYLAPPATSERDAEDAARYRELRNGGRLFVRGDWSGYLGDYTRLSGAQLDSALDAQREQSSKEGGNGNHD